MKQLTSYNRTAGYLNKIFDLLNAEFFENTLSRPTITIQSTPKAYGHFTLREDTWVSTIGSTHEINIGAGTLSRPIENVVATLLHEMIHYYNYENGVQDCSRGGTYHNKNFKREAEKRGLIVNKSEKYGYAHTEPADCLLDFVLNNGLTDILISRNEFFGFSVPPIGKITGTDFGSTAKKSSTRKYICPCCGMSIRATKEVRIMCMDCGEQMILESDLSNQMKKAG
ncbi:MAG: SprT-like domain-containing protein [Oscillospiraceae bacterium]|nr:SprT-like domain-containing protein [Oscillospiraceae bacterium]